MTKLLVTVDTEGDDEWTWRERATAANGLRLPRLQQLCEDHGLPPTYLVTYDMLADDSAAAILRDIARSGAGEIGAHLHVWRTPPRSERYDRSLSFASELPEQLVYDKLRTLTEFIEERTGFRPLSHRAGRYGFDARQIGMLEELGYTVDSSVTPWISWQSYAGLPGGPGGPDYTGAPEEPYYLHPEDVMRPGTSSILEVPLSIRVEGPTPRAFKLWYARQAPARTAQRLVQRLGLARRREMRPALYTLEQMKAHAQGLVGRNCPVLNLLIHSSELLPGGSPYHATEEDVSVFLAKLEELFLYLTRELGVTGSTLASFAAEYCPESTRSDSGEVHAV